MQFLIATSRLARITSPRERGEVGRRAQRGIRVRGRRARLKCGAVADRPLTPALSPQAGRGRARLPGLRFGPPFGDRPVGARDDFEEMTVGVLEIEAAAAVE